MRVNEMIRAREVRVIDEDGQQLGILAVDEARSAAQERGLDLIEVAPQADPPVCRIMDYGKFRYEQQKKEKESQKKSRQIEIKTIRVRPNTDDHDLAYKMRNARKFLQKGRKVKFNVIFRGPELRHTNIGRRQLEYFAQQCADLADIDQSPRMEHRNMTMLLTPKPEVAEEALSDSKDGSEGSDKDGQGKGKDTESSREAVQDHGDGSGSAQETGTQPSAVQEDQQA
jgi:translation initiation factor IF-3